MAEDRHVPRSVEKEQGQGQIGIVPWSGLFDPNEETPEVQWPRSIRTYGIMDNDAQLNGLMRGVTLPIRRFKWFIDPNDARPEVVAMACEDWGLPEKGKQPIPRKRNKGKFQWDFHLRHALYELKYGFMFFEQVYKIDPLGYARIRKWAPRMPATISKIDMASDGGLESITQYGTGKPGEPNQITLDVNRLIAYVNDQESGSWIGKSLYRPCYKHWLLKDRLMRVDGLKHERNGMGIPIGKAGPNTSPAALAELNKMTQRLKVGDTAGGALPEGTDIELKGVTGSLPDTLASIRYHDEQMAHQFLEMFVQLGSTQHGTRNLGEAFIEFFAYSTESIAGQIADTASDHGMEDWVDLNWGPDEASPRIGFEMVDDPSITVDGLAALIKAGAITVDEEIEDWVRSRYKMPAVPEGFVRPAKAPVVDPAATGA